MSRFKLAAWLVLAGIVLQSAAEIGSHAADAQPASPAPSTDWIAAEMARCRGLGLAAATDPDCQAATKANQDRFFGQRIPYEPRPIDIFPATSDTLKLNPVLPDSQERKR